MSNFDIKNVNYIHREKATYEEKTIRINFESEEAFLFYQNNTLNKHATWCSYQHHIVKANASIKSEYASKGRFHVSTIKFRCDHAGDVKNNKKKGKSSNSITYLTFLISIIFLMYHQTI